MTKPTKTAGTASTSQSCWFSIDDPASMLMGGIWPMGANGEPIAQIVVKGAASTPFVLDPGDYRFEFNMVAADKLTLTLYVHGQKTKCSPSTFDPADGTVDRVSRFTI
jgi:hypothetical protein